MADQPFVDGVTAGNDEDQADTPAKSATSPAAEPADDSQVDPVVRGRVRFVILSLFSLPYAFFVFWCLFLMSVLPSPSGQFESLISIGSLTAVGGALLLAVIGLLASQRAIHKKKLTTGVRAMSFGRLAAIFLPGIILGGLVPVVITAEPRLTMDITDPVGDVELVAPIAITYSVERAVDILARRGLSPRLYQWDYTNDGTIDEDGVVPTKTARYSRSGLVQARVVIHLSDGTTRAITRETSIPREVFSVEPFKPLVDEPVIFSVKHLMGTTLDQNGNQIIDLKQVEWDFDEDGIPDEVTTDPDIDFTFSRVGPVEVVATVTRQSGGVEEYKKQIMIEDQPPLPFPVSLKVSPENLTGPPPLGVQFEVVTEEPIASVDWKFGDGSDSTGMAVGHKYNEVGNFIVNVAVRSKNGDTARLSEVVRVTKRLNLTDLQFNGTPEPIKDGANWRISGELPLTVELRPRTNQQFITFTWDAPEATVVGSVDEELEATYRRPGKYTIYLFGQDLDGSAFRLPIEVEVKQPAPDVVLLLKPNNGPAPLEVAFDATQTSIPGETITGFIWNFDYDPDDDEFLAAPDAPLVTHTYIEPGNYVAQVTVTTAQGNRYSTESTISVTPSQLSSCFTASRTELDAGGGVTFNRSCTAGSPDRIEWDFGDGSKSGDMETNSIDHEFLTPGTYTVRLTIWRGSQSDSESLQISVR